MKDQNYLETEFLDIIFQGRNKEYGAYYIRKTYAQRVKKSLATLVLLVSIGLALASFKPLPDDIPDVPPIVLETYDIVEIQLPPDAGRNLAGMIPVVPEPVPFVEIMPEFPGGEKALIDFIQNNMKYPKLAKKLGTEGKVFVEFVIDENGNISSIKVAKGIGGGCDQEAVRVIDRMPKWSPGVQNGKHVPVSYRLPITFTLN